MGGGLELALACDLRVAAVDARLGLPEVRLGLLPAAGGTQRLTRLCGQGTAKRLILGAELIDGAEALRLGLVQWTQPREQLARWSRELAARVADMPKAALGASKRCIAAAHDPACDGFASRNRGNASVFTTIPRRAPQSLGIPRPSAPHDVIEGDPMSFERQGRGRYRRRLRHRPGNRRSAGRSRGNGHRRATSIATRARLRPLPSATRTKRPNSCASI